MHDGVMSRAPVEHGRAGYGRYCRLMVPKIDGTIMETVQHLRVDGVQGRSSTCTGNNERNVASKFGKFSICLKLVGKQNSFNFGQQF